MLTKLLKYEIKATARIFLPLYVVLIVFAAISKLLFTFSDNSSYAPAIISAITYIIILVGMFVMTFVVMIQRFYKNLLSDEGYLMFTLPAETWKHITSKLLVSMMWSVASGIAGLLSIIILAFDELLQVGFWTDFSRFLYQFFGTLGLSTGSLVILEFILAFILNMAFGILIIYASIAIGHLFNRRRIVAALGAFLALGTLTQILFFSSCSITKLNRPAVFIESLENIEHFHAGMWFLIIFTGLISAGYFIITNHILSKRLNLE